MSTDGHGRTTSRHYDISGSNPRESNQTIASRLTSSSCTVGSTTPFAWPLGSRGRRQSWHSTMVSKTPRVLLRITRGVQIFCSILVLAAAIFSVVKFGIQREEVLVVREGTQYLDLQYDSLPDGRGDWRPVLLVVLSSVSLIAFPLLTVFRRRRVSVVVEVVLLGLWCSFMTLYVPTITAPFEPNCLHPKAPFEFLDDHTEETSAVGIDIGRNSTDNSSTGASHKDPSKINSEIFTYCVMSQVGVASGLIIIIFTFLSILLLLLLSYQATDFLIERRALELLHHHGLPVMVQQGISPISNAYQTITNSIPPLRATQRPLDEENNFPPHHGLDDEPSMHNDGISHVHPHHQNPQSKGKAPMYSFTNPQSLYQNPTQTLATAPISDASTLGANPAPTLSTISTRSQHDQSGRTDHERIADSDDETPRPLQLKGWVTQGYQVRGPATH